MVTSEEVINFFQDALPTVTTMRLKPIPLELDSVLQERAELEDIAQAIDDYAEKFSIDVSMLNIKVYFPWIIPWFFRSWFTKKPVVQSKKPLTVRMFAESAKAGRWLYD